MNHNVLVVSILLILTIFSTLSFAGNEAGNGGQKVAADFAQAMSEVIQILNVQFTSDGFCTDSPELAQYRPLCRLNHDQLSQTFSNTKLIAVPELTNQDPNT